MTRKDYVLMAGVFAARVALAQRHESPVARSIAVGAIRRTAGALADALKADNPRFDRATFLRAADAEDFAPAAGGFVVGERVTYINEGDGLVAAGTVGTVRDGERKRGHVAVAFDGAGVTLDVLPSNLAAVR